MEYLNLSSSQNWTLEYPKQLVPPLRITHFRRFWGAFSEPPMLSLVIQCHALPLITHRPNFFWIHDRRPKRHLDCLNLTNWATQKWGTSGRTNRDGHCIKLVLVFNHPIFICRWSIMLIKYDQILFPQTWPTLHMLRLWRSHACIGCCDSGYPAIEPLRRRTQGQSWLWKSLDFGTLTRWKPQYAFQSPNIRLAETKADLFSNWRSVAGGNQHQSTPRQTALRVGEPIEQSPGWLSTWSNWFQLSHSKHLPPDAASKLTPQPGRASRALQRILSLGKWWCEIFGVRCVGVLDCIGAFLRVLDALLHWLHESFIYWLPAWSAAWSINLWIDWLVEWASEYYRCYQQETLRSRLKTIKTYFTLHVTTMDWKTQ